MTVVFASFIRDSATQMVMLDNFNSVGNCNNMCRTAFADSKASWLVVAKRLNHTTWNSRHNNWKHVPLPTLLR